ncbi:MAG: hypothetical protein Q9209_006396 [Squamulea sp. 1 TL-2023]
MTQTYHTVGGTHVVTRAYDANALSTVRCVNSLGVGKDKPSVVWEAINYDDLYYPIPLSASLSRVDRCFSNRKDNEVWGDWMRKPFISLPADVSEIDPAWTTCSGVKIGAMDPPRALVPASGFHDPPLSKPENPPSAEPITQAPPSLPKATPGKTVPEPVPGPTNQPQQGDNPSVRPKPELGNDPAETPNDPLQDPPSNPPAPSPVEKESSASPEVPAPVPQESSLNRPTFKVPGDTERYPGNGIETPPPALANGPIAKQQPAKQGEEHRDSPSDFGLISSALFPGPSPSPDQVRQRPSNKKQGQTPEGQQSPALDKSYGGSSTDSKNPSESISSVQGSDLANTGTNTDMHPSGTNHYSPNEAVNLQNDAPSRKDDLLAPGDSGGSGTPDSGAIVDGSGSQGSSAVGNPPKEPQQHENPSEGTLGNTAQLNPPTTAGKQSNTSPMTFDFVSEKPPTVAGSHTIARAPDGGAVVEGTTIRPGNAQVVHGTPISVASNAIVVGSSSFEFRPPSSPQTPAAAPIIKQGPNGGLVVGATTIMQGDWGLVNDHKVSVGSSNVIIDGKPFALPAATAHPASSSFNVGGLQVVAGSNDGVVVAGSTLSLGAQATISSHAVSIGLGIVAIDGTAHSLPTTLAKSPLLVDGQTIREDSNGNVIVGSSTVKPGTRATIAGHTISVVANDKIIIDQNTYALPVDAGIVQVSSSPSQTPASLVIIDGKPVHQDAQGNLVIGTTTVSPGAQITVAGHTISAAPSNIVLDGKTLSLPANAISISVQSVFTVGGEPFTAAPAGFAVAGTTVSPEGPAVTISGTVVSLGTAGLVIGTKTVPLPSSVAEATGLGDVIMSGFGSPEGSRQVGTPTPAPTPAGSPGNVTTFNLGSGTSSKRLGLGMMSIMVMSVLSWMMVDLW